MPEQTLSEIDGKIERLEEQLKATHRQLAELRRSRPPEPVGEYTLYNPDKTPVRLSELFGDKNDLILIHNMGQGCPYLYPLGRRIQRRASAPRKPGGVCARVPRRSRRPERILIRSRLEIPHSVQ